MIVCSFANVLGISQTILLLLFLTCTKTSLKNGEVMYEYIIFRDIMIMLLLGFGFLMSFLKKYGLTAVGLTMMLTAFALQLNLLLEPLTRFVYDSDSVDFPISIGIPNLIDGEFAAATLLISFGCVIGRATPGQLFFMAVFESIFYSINKTMIVFGALAAEDVGGTITIHLFGAYFGIAVSRAFRSPKPGSLENSGSSPISDILSLLGTGILWVYWPSFVGATETGNAVNENHCIIHTVSSLLGSTLATFYVSRMIGGKFNPFHIANATLAGGVAVGVSARLDISVGGALLLGILAGAISTLGFIYVSPMLETKLDIYDTCGVHNLHGMPSILGGLASAIFVTVDSGADFLQHEDTRTQAGHQVLAVLATLAFALTSGWLTGIVLVKCSPSTPSVEYDDAAWWESSYLNYEGVLNDKSNHSHGGVLPVINNIEPTRE